MRLGETIRAQRQALGITQRDLAKLVDASPAYINDIELERRMPRDRERLTQMANALNMPADVLFYCLGLLRREDDQQRDAETIVRAYDAFYAVLGEASSEHKPVSNPLSNVAAPRTEYPEVASKQQISQTE